MLPLLSHSSYVAAFCNLFSFSLFAYRLRVRGTNPRPKSQLFGSQGIAWQKWIMAAAVEVEHKDNHRRAHKDKEEVKTGG